MRWLHAFIVCVAHWHDELNISYILYDYKYAIYECLYICIYSFIIRYLCASLTVSAQACAWHSRQWHSRHGNIRDELVLQRTPRKILIQKSSCSNLTSASDYKWKHDRVPGLIADIKVKFPKEDYIGVYVSHGRSKTVFEIKSAYHKRADLMALC